MNSVQTFREFVSERLSAAAGEIFSVFEQKVVEYREEVDVSSRGTNGAAHPPLLVIKDEKLFHQETNLSPDRGKEDPPQIKEEQEELCISLEGDQLTVKQEADVLMMTAVDEEEELTEQHRLHNSVRRFINERLTAAGEEIFTMFEQTIEKIDGHHRGLGIACKERIACPQQHVYTEEQLCKQGTKSILNQEEPEPAQIKEDQEDFCIDQEGEHLELKQEIDAFIVTSTDEERIQSEPELEDEQILCNESAATETQDQRETEHFDVMVSRNAEWDFTTKQCGDNIDNCLSTRSRSETETDKKSLTCGICGKAFKFISQLQRHHRSHTGERPHSCGICEKGFREHSSLLVHMRTHSGEKPYSCETCGKSFSKQCNMLVHMRTHTGEKLYTCKTCGKDFSRHSNLLVHMRTHTGEKPHICVTCGKGFSRQSYLLLHMRTHTGEKPYSCETCDKSFAQPGHLLVHMKTHTGEKPHSCETCGKSFVQHSLLLRHMRVHTGEKPYSCEQCEKSFTQPSHLLVHMKTHTNEKLHSCPTCGRSFKQQSYLLIHMRTHTHEKPYSCEICGKCFSIESNLLSHIRTHSDEKSFTCEICKKSFKLHSNLSNHMRTHTGEKPFFCETCGKRFSRNDYLLVHMRTHTGQMAES